MSLDPRLIEVARQVQRAHDPGYKGSALGPVRYLIAEFIYLEMSPRHIFDFVQKAEIKISYGGMFNWIKRNFGRGDDAVLKAAKILQKAADDGAYASPYFVARAGPESARQPQPAAQSWALMPALQGDRPRKRSATRPGSSRDIAPSVAIRSPSTPTTLTDPEAEAREVERIRLKEERVRKGREFEKRRLDANPFARIANRQQKDERSDK